MLQQSWGDVAWHAKIFSYIYKLCRPREMDHYFIEHCLLTSSVGKQHTNVIFILFYYGTYILF